MQLLLQIFGWMLAIPLSLILLYLAFELFMGLARSRQRDATPFPSGSTAAILVPAHNEAIGIAGTVEALRAVAPAFRIVVVADNCTDNTAELARSAGAEAIVRSDANRRGKGFALAFGRDYLAKDPPGVVVIIDADCRLSAGSAECLVARALHSGSPVQSVNLLVTATDASPLVRISNFAMLIKNLVRARGLSRIGGGALLFGTGMAFPWKMFATLELATSHAVEDLDLALSLSGKGVRIVFEENALVTSPAATVSDSKGQRSRWEHGFLGAALRRGLPLILAGARARSLHLLAIGAHMMVPPLAMLMIASFGVTGLLLCLSYFSGTAAPLLLLASCLMIASLAILAAWWTEGRGIIGVRSLLLVPLYVLWKIPIYVGFFTSRQTAWNRTHRDGEHP